MTAEKTSEPTLALEGAVIEPSKPVAKGKALAAHKGQPVESLPVGSVTPMDMLNRAVASGADLDMIEKLMNLQERWEAGNARKAFDKAVAAAKKEIPPITRNATGHNSKKYADFAAIARVVDPIIGAHGLSYRFRTVQDDRIHVTCILSHEDGHSEQTTLSGPADGSGNKNAIQAIGSTLTYLQRYSLVQMLGLAAAADDDGFAAAKSDEPRITDEQVMALREKCEAVGCPVPKFLKWARCEALEDIPASFYDGCVAGLDQFRKAK
jgi:hypothetical protein